MAGLALTPGLPRERNGRLGHALRRRAATVDLDHVFLACQGPPPGSLEGSQVAAADLAATLRLAGFTEGSRNTHPGQGTANRRFFFERFMFELLFVEDSKALASAFAPLHLHDRFIPDAAFPFGIGFRPSVVQGERAGFPCVEYRPEFFPGHAHIEVMDGGFTSDPLIFHLPFLTPFSKTSGLISSGADEPREHACGAARLQSMVLESRVAPSSRAAAVLSQCGIRTQQSDADRLILSFTSDDEQPQRCLVDTPMLSIYRGEFSVGSDHGK